MTTGELQLDISKKCEGKCKCGKKYGEFIAEKKEKDPEKGYSKQTHKLQTKQPFKLARVKYRGNLVAISTIYDVYSVIEVSVYYDNDYRPYIIELHNGGNNKEYYVNNKPSNSQDEEDWSANMFWTKNDDLSKLERLKDKLEELSCEYANSVPVDIFKKIKRKNHHCSLSLNILGRTFTDDIYQFRQTTSRNKPFKVNSIKYNGREIPINIPPEGVKEISTFYWRYNLGRPLAVKILYNNGKIEYHFNKGRVTWQWSKETLQDSEFLGRLIGHNCTRNRATTIDMSKTQGDYCCTDYCRFKRINVTKQSELFQGFTSYEHKAIKDYPFTIHNIINHRHEKQKGIKYPIHDVYDVTVYYCNVCQNEPLFMSMSYKLDGFLEYTWYKRITLNGWEQIPVPDNYDDIFKVLRNNLETLSKALIMGCDVSKLDPDGRKEKKLKEPKVYPLFSPEETLDNIVARSKDDPKIFVPRGPPKDEDQEQQEENEAQENEAIAKMVEQGDTIPEAPSPPKLAKKFEKLGSPISVQKLKETKAKVDSTFPKPTFLRTPSPGVVIDIKKDDTNTPYTVESNKESVRLTKIEDPPGSGFIKFTHIASAGEPFRVAQVKYGPNGPTVDVGVKDNIKHLSVWYWKGITGNMTNPLFIEVWKEDGKYDYHLNKGNSGSSIEWSPYKKMNHLHSQVNNLRRN